MTGLFLRLRLARDRRAMGVLSAIGFSSRELAGTVRGTTLVMVGAGVLAGAVIAATLGEAAVGTVIGMSGVGITQLRFIENPWLVWLAYPAGLVTVGWLVSIALTASIRRADKSAWLKGADGA